MAWDVNQIFNFLKWLQNKNQAGSISSTDFFYAWNSEQTAYQEDLLGKWQNRNNGKEGNNTGLIQNETILTKLTPFTIPTTLTVTAGDATKPEDFIYTMALRIDGYKVTHVNHNAIWSLNEDVIDPPSIPANKYYYTEYEDYFRLLPDTVTSVDLDYVATVTDVVWGYTIDGSGRQVYDPSTSVQPKWLQNTIVEVTKRTLKGFAVHFKDGDFAAYGQSNITTGD